MSLRAVLTFALFPCVGLRLSQGRLIVSLSAGATGLTGQTGFTGTTGVPLLSELSLPLYRSHAWVFGCLKAG